MINFDFSESAFDWFIWRRIGIVLQEKGSPWQTKLIGEVVFGLQGRGKGQAIPMENDSLEN